MRLIIYGMSGWILEIFWTGMGSLFFQKDPRLTGHTYLWMFFIYGSAVFLEPLHDAIRDQHILVRGLIYTFIIFSFEYLSGYLLRELIGVCPWNYSGSRFSVDGLIRLDYAPVWFVLGLIFEKMHDYMDSIIQLR